jgi:hypothetical protein
VRKKRSTYKLFLACSLCFASTNFYTQSLQDYFPLKLFFANDEPNPRSFATRTTLSYSETYKSYEQKFLDYQKQGEYFDVLVENEIIPNYQKLKGLKQTLVDTLLTGKRVVLQVKGFASPLHHTDYNVNISKRRISSFVNELSSNKELHTFLKNGKLIIEELPFGEYATNPDANDQLDSLNLSVYHINASYERRVEVEHILILPDSAAYLGASTTYFNAAKTSMGSKIKVDFPVTNLGYSDLTIQRIAVSCGCSIADIQQEVLKAGESTILHVEVDTNELALGKDAKSITVFYNNGLSKRFVVLLEVE